MGNIISKGIKFETEKSKVGKIKPTRVKLNIQRQQMGQDLFSRETILGGRQEEEGSLLRERKMFKLRSDFV